MKKPHWKPEVDYISGWGLVAQSEHFAVLLRPGLTDSWEWAIGNRSGVLVQRGEHADLIAAIAAAETAWEGLPNG